ncbi:hypothetical protein AGMMS50284_3400 [Clostridia bacterium]|nr:hypothetical protein AGMMS50284_3400 [Clostridia bacterium]
MRGYISYFADDNAVKLALFKKEDKKIWKTDRKDSPIFKLIDYNTKPQIRIALYPRQHRPRRRVA